MNLVRFELNADRVSSSQISGHKLTLYLVEPIRLSSAACAGGFGGDIPSYVHAMCPRRTGTLSSGVVSAGARKKAIVESVVRASAPSRRRR